jgi:hypothetical protein
MASMPHLQVLSIVWVNLCLYCGNRRRRWLADTCIHYDQGQHRYAYYGTIADVEGGIIRFIFGCPVREETQRWGPADWPPPQGGWEGKLNC